MAEELQKMKKQKAFEKKAFKQLPEEQRKKLQDHRFKKQVATFLMPDAPPRKTRRTESPERVPCPLVPGTPETPPPRKPQAWELKKRVTTPSLAASGLSRASDLPDPETFAAFRSDIASTSGVVPFLLTPSTGVVQATNTSGFETVNASFELVGFSPECSLFDDLEENNIQQTYNPGSDIDDDDDNNAPNETNFVEDLELIDKMDAQDDQVLSTMATEDMLYFDWSSDNIFSGKKEPFLGRAGPTFDVTGLSPFQIMEKIWDKEIMSMICQETNRYAEAMKNGPDVKPHARIRKWVPLTVDELWTFFGLLMMHSLLPLPVEKEYWIPKFSWAKVGCTGEIMALRRFLLIKRNLHFVDNLAQSFSTNTSDKLKKIQPIITHLNTKFSSLYLPEQNIAIDESLLLWKGRLSFAQLIATKAAQVGIKSYELCESKSGYLWKMVFYTGKSGKSQYATVGATNDEPAGVTSQIVFHLMRPLLNMGHCLVMDNFYNSPLLSRCLKAKKTDTMGTLRLNRGFVPESLRRLTKNNMRVGEICASQTRDIAIIVFRDSNLVSTISTFHKPEVGGKEKHGQYRYRPQVVLDYNLFMGGVDKKDQLLQAFPVERVRNLVWYKKLFRRLLNISIMNAHIIHSSASNLNSRDFRGLLADEIITRFRPTMPSIVPKMHFPAKTGKRKSRCKLCAMSKNDVCTVWKCESCAVNLCMPECFKKFHQ